MIDTRYTPGDATAVVTSHLALLVADPGPEQLAALWELATTRPDVVGLLDVLGEAGISQMPDFAAAVWTETHVRIVVRGSFVADVDTDGGSQLCDGLDVSTWSERAVPRDGVGRLRLISGPGSDPVRHLPLQAGIVLAAEVEVGGWVSEDAAPVERPPLAEPVVDPEPEPTPEPEREPEPEPEPELVAVLVPASDPSATLVDPGEDAFDALFGATVAGRRPEDAAVREIDDPPAPPPLSQVAPPPPFPFQIAHGELAPPADAARLADQDNRTLTPAEFARMRAVRAGSAPVQLSAPKVVLRLSTGREVEVSRPVLIGRAPRAQNTSSADLPLLVVVDEPYVSGTHLEVAVVDGVPMATDLSTNGTALSAHGQPRRMMAKGVRTALADGSVLHVTDEITISVNIS